jgi:tRNA C32,U32 (ribose-2'-O)-methylase TrmJ
MLEKVLPQIQPDVEKFLIYNIEQILSQSTPYQQLQVLPGVRSLQTQMMNQIIGQLYERTLEALQSLLKQDPVFDELLENLVENLRQTTHREMTAKQSFSTIETLLTELMEEVKINYVKELSQTDIDRIVEESRALRQLNRLDKK